MKAKMEFYSKWYAWKRASLGKTDAKLEEMGPKPTLSGFLRI